MFNNIPDAENSLFMDDGLLWATGSSINNVIDKLQNALRTIEEWGRKNGVKFLFS